jgi:hypothetical protein
MPRSSRVYVHPPKSGDICFPVRSATPDRADLPWPEMEPRGGVLNYVYIFLPLVTNYAIYFLAFYVEALKQDPEEFRKPGPLDPGGGPYIKDGSRNSSAKPTYAQYARSGGDILAGPVLAWGLGLANAAFSRTLGLGFINFSPGTAPTPLLWPDLSLPARRRPQRPGYRVGSSLRLP